MDQERRRCNDKSFPSASQFGAAVTTTPAAQARRQGLSGAGWAGRSGFGWMEQGLLGGAGMQADFRPVCPACWRGPLNPA